VAGIIGATADNARGVAGVAPSVSILSATACNGAGLCWGSDVAQGITWAVDNGATVINLSLGFASPSQSVKAAVDNAVSRGVVVLAAAGNDGTNTVSYPAAHDGVIGVGSHDSAGNRSVFSQTGSHVDVLAPGEFVLATGNASDTAYVEMSGTSMATPHAAGVVALLRGSRPNATAAQVTAALTGGALDLGAAGRDDASGFGRIRIGASLDALAAAVPASPGAPPVAPPATEPAPRTDAPAAAPRAGLIGPSGPIVVRDGQVVPVGGDLPAPPAGVRWAATSQTATGNGAWVADTRGRIVVSGDAGTYGDLPSLGVVPNQPINAMAPTATGRGYWMSAADGGIFAFGDATFRGSMGGQLLNKPIVGMAADPNGQGYWQVASDGGIFAHGVPFFGSTGNLTLNRPINGMAVTPTGKGYWLFATDGGIFAYGDAKFFGSLPGVPGAGSKTAVGMISSPTGNGYWIVTSDNSVYAFGDAA
jgi:hypothetical protein